ncbi:hypothetical protein IAG44_14290 [Streptomyces roseirectus]|uniref:Uncharacterized protein n=1 Tax=Streptomyces roseirectus TaxID=2768066 RepID=A0A7H0ICH8_9ACTN|nr:hypothetical protein [Streptomyces roseirectus]QNP70494.1 hypothetical protein IAG44_14290 [Streptomyces roseirectus]
MRARLWNALPVPWIAPWSGERGRSAHVTRQSDERGRERLGFTDEEHSDRRDGMLWVRMAATPGRGRPDFAGLHPLRQRQAMTHLLCQVCGGPTVGSREDERHLFLARSTGTRLFSEGETTAVPPVHESCALQSLRHCPHLRKGWTAALVGWAPAWGAAGTLYHPDSLEPVSRDLCQVPYDKDRLLRWLVAAREVVSLHEIERIDLARLEGEQNPTRERNS